MFGKACLNAMPCFNFSVNHLNNYLPSTNKLPPHTLTCFLRWTAVQVSPLQQGFQPEGGAADSHGETHRSETSPLHILPSILLSKRQPSLPRSESTLGGESTVSLNSTGTNIPMYTLCRKYPCVTWVHLCDCVVWSRWQ